MNESVSAPPRQPIPQLNTSMPIYQTSRNHRLIAIAEDDQRRAYNSAGLSLSVQSVRAHVYSAGM